MSVLVLVVVYLLLGATWAAFNSTSHFAREQRLPFWAQFVGVGITLLVWPLFLLLTLMVLLVRR